MNSKRDNCKESLSKEKDAKRAENSGKLCKTAQNGVWAYNVTNWKRWRHKGDSPDDVL